MSWKLVAAGVTLRDQINKRWPKRDKASDGSVGDAAHAARASDHNPDSRGWVHAIDIDKDLRGSRSDTQRLADELIKLAREGKDKGRLKNIVWNDKVASGTYKDSFWVWRGSGYGHYDHIHVSFTNKAEADGSEFPLDILKLPYWDGVAPMFENCVNASMGNHVKSPASWRIACRLADLGYYNGVPQDKGEQEYPRIAVKAWQQAHGEKETGNYTPSIHHDLFGVIV